MRLIDADALIEDLKQYLQKCADTEQWDDVMEQIERVDKQPTIDAIPIKKFCEWLEECGCNIFKEAFTINVQLFRAALDATTPPKEVSK